MEIIQQYFPDLSPRQYDQLGELKEIYSYWNERINVISRKDMDAFYTHHVLHSMVIAKQFSFDPKAQILDLGTGGGFPGVPLAILFPETSFHLVDSIAKKVKVVGEVCQSIGIENVLSEHNRVEKVKGDYQYVVTRAVAQLTKLVAWTKDKFDQEAYPGSKTGLICLKGGDLNEERRAVKWKSKEYNLSKWYSDPFFETKKIIHCYPPKKK